MFVSQSSGDNTIINYYYYDCYLDDHYDDIIMIAIAVVVVVNVAVSVDVIPASELFFY
jgi:hypothetical protein